MKQSFWHLGSSVFDLYEIIFTKNCNVFNETPIEG